MHVFVQLWELIYKEQKELKEIKKTEKQKNYFIYEGIR